MQLPDQFSTSDSRPGDPHLKVIRTFERSLGFNRLKLRPSQEPDATLHAPVGAKRALLQ